MIAGDRQSGVHVTLRAVTYTGVAALVRSEWAPRQVVQFTTYLSLLPSTHRVAVA